MLPELQMPVVGTQLLLFTGVLLLVGYFKVWKPLADRVARIEGKVGLEGYTPAGPAWLRGTRMDQGYFNGSNKDGMIPHEPPVYYANQDPDAVASSNLENAMLEPDGEVAGVGWAPEVPASAAVAAAVAKAEGYKNKKTQALYIDGMKPNVLNQSLNPY